MKNLLQHGVTEQVQRREGATALVCNGARMTYGELEETSNRLAQLLLDTGIGRGDRVGLLMPKMSAAVVGMLGALKADAAYVPLDPREPPARLARTLESADCRWVLAAGPVDRALNDALSAARLEPWPLIGWLDEAYPPDAQTRAVFTLRDLIAFPAGLPPSVNRGGDLAHILFAYDFAGAADGVMVTHAGVVRFIRWATDHFGIVSSDRISQHSPLRFALSTLDIFSALWAGAEVHFVPHESSLLPHKLAQFVRDARITQWSSAPSVMTLMAKFNVVRDNDFPALRRVLYAGGVLRTRTLTHWMRRLPHARFTNLHGLRIESGDRPLELGELERDGDDSRHIELTADRSEPCARSNLANSAAGTGGLK